MTEHLTQLGPDTDKLNVVFVTVDPERDTPAVTKEYLSSFDPRVTGCAGTSARIAAMAKSFFVYFGRPVLGAAIISAWLRSMA